MPQEMMWSSPSPTYFFSSNLTMLGIFGDISLLQVRGKDEQRWEMIQKKNYGEIPRYIWVEFTPQVKELFKTTREGRQRVLSL